MLYGLLGCFFGLKKIHAVGECYLFVLCRGWANAIRLCRGENAIRLCRGANAIRPYGMANLFLALGLLAWLLFV
jgi:hypothetical protein